MSHKRLLKIPIAVKLIVIFVGFLTIATIIFAQQSAELFEKVLVTREEYSNMTEASAKATEVEQTILTLFDRAQQLGQMYFKDLNRGAKAGDTGAVSETLKEFENSFAKEKSIVSIEIWTEKDQQLQLLGRKSKNEFLTKNKLNPNFFEELRNRQNFPLTSVLKKSIEIRNASSPEGAALATIGIPLVRNDQDQVTHVMLVDFSLNLLQKSFAGDSERIQYLIDKNGNLLAHPDDKRVLAAQDISKAPLVARALADEQPRRQIQFYDDELKDKYIGAYIRLSSLGLTILSQTSKTIILEPAVQVKRRAFYIAGIVISVAIVMIFMFSMTLTGPIEMLAVMVAHVSKGNFNVKAGDQVKSWIEDEVHDLAKAFDGMTEGLKERDKVKSLFSKFHGSSVAEDLINNDMGVHGQNRMVTVFFSDIRGFTAFSENRSPEEVVAMLNEYFEVMVGIINRHGGVVDKFIGDAIMAVWGAPKATENDTHNALRACIEMRRSLAILNARRAEREQPPIKIGMGLHTGPAISGTIGSNERMEYTVIGDTVNMTSRIEASTKAFGTDLLVSQAIVDKVQDAFVLNLAGAATVKGKTEPLSLFKVRGYKEADGTVVEVTTEFSDFEAEDDEKVKKSA